MIPESFIQELLNRVDLVELVGKVVPLKKTGKNFMGCCPFHKEKTPSFSISPQKQFYKCFGCGASGSAIGFVMQYEGLSYPDAIRRLAESMAMTVPEDPVATRRTQQVKTLSDYMLEACSYYREALKTHTTTRHYLEQRRITAETAARFALGYSPEGWQNLRDVFADRYEAPELEEQHGCGLVIVNETGRRYDRFRGRLMFPIRNPRGQVIGFGARTLNGDEHPKYLNSPETAIYHKGQEIYGLYEAHDTIRHRDRVIVCEGYMDVIQLSQAGFEESVAALGTAITSDHVRKLLRLVDHVYFCFDGDTAGQHALRRAMEAALPVVGDSQEVRFVVLPPEHDPDSLIKEQGAADFDRALGTSLTLSEYFVSAMIGEKNLLTAEGRSQFLAESKPLIVSMSAAPLLRTQIVAELAMRARMNPDDLERAYGIAPVRSAALTRDRARPSWKQRGDFRRAGAALPRAQMADKVERLLQNLLNFPELAVEFSACIEEHFVSAEDALSRQIIEVWRAVTGSEVPVVQPQVVLDALKGSEHAGHYQTLMARELVVQTTLETARFETQDVFDRLEVEHTQEVLEKASHAPVLDFELIRAANNKLNALRVRIARAASARETQL